MLLHTFLAGIPQLFLKCQVSRWVAIVIQCLKQLRNFLLLFNYEKIFTVKLEILLRGRRLLFTDCHCSCHHNSLTGQIVLELNQGLELNQKYLDLCSWVPISWLYLDFYSQQMELIEDSTLLWENYAFPFCSLGFKWPYLAHFLLNIFFMMFFPVAFKDVSHFCVKTILLHTLCRSMSFK